MMKITLKVCKNDMWGEGGEDPIGLGIQPFSNQITPKSKLSFELLQHTNFNDNFEHTRIMV